ncbi:hypothetical protein LNKW23_12020 [Paralimibaculum aggregatum]|uniref:Thioredoxin family protein n=1 Tax=Paralimibaculum aggregatum TaxID=3036245 RepID=A0ABQ6LMX3_9RHOB|nr:thioredoxin family protein [Limibaculum sp. NKW23]GMG81989.1 hypothetical protein LNKW23_12020 [Limibaculum sp. NKW23]
MSCRALLALIAVLLGPAAPAAAGELRLLMLDQQGCEWCEQWDAEVGVVYDRTAEGRQAPLLRGRIHDPLPEGVALARRAHYTPTFVLLEDGAEIGRIEGYPGEDFFYGMLGRLLARARPPDAGPPPAPLPARPPAPRATRAGDGS